MRCTPFPIPVTTSTAGRTVHIAEHDRLVRGHRGRWVCDEQMRHDYKAHRPMIERSIARMTRGTCDTEV